LHRTRNNNYDQTEEDWFSPNRKSPKRRGNPTHTRGAHDPSYFPINDPYSDPNNALFGTQEDDPYKSELNMKGDDPWNRMNKRNKPRKLGDSQSPLLGSDLDNSDYNKPKMNQGFNPKKDKPSYLGNDNRSSNGAFDDPSDDSYDPVNGGKTNPNANNPYSGNYPFDDYNMQNPYDRSSPYP